MWYSSSSGNVLQIDNYLLKTPDHGHLHSVYADQDHLAVPHHRCLLLPHRATSLGRSECGIHLGRIHADKSCYVHGQAERSHCLHRCDSGLSGSGRSHSSQHEREHGAGILAFQRTCTPNLPIWPDGLRLPLQGGWGFRVWICCNYWHWRAASKQSRFQLWLLRNRHVVLDFQQLARREGSSCAKATGRAEVARGQALIGYGGAAA